MTFEEIAVEIAVGVVGIVFGTGFLVRLGQTIFSAKDTQLSNTTKPA